MSLALSAPKRKSGSSGVTIHDLKDGHCRRPLWGKSDTGGPHEKFYCGAPAPAGQPWCKTCAPLLTETLKDRRRRMRGRKASRGDKIRGAEWWA